MRQQHRLGSDPFDPHDNILAGAAYLPLAPRDLSVSDIVFAPTQTDRELGRRFVRGGLLPAETRALVGDITLSLQNGGAILHWKKGEIYAAERLPSLDRRRRRGTVRAPLRRIRARVQSSLPLDE